MVTALAMGAALLLGGGPLLVSQAATSAVLVTTIQVPTDGISLARFLDALAGGAIGARRGHAPPARGARAGGAQGGGSRCSTSWPWRSRRVADALERRDQETAELAVLRAREIVLPGPREALAAARDSTRLTLRPERHRRARGALRATSWRRSSWR